MKKLKNSGNELVAIKTPSLGEAESIGPMHLQSCLETYVSPALGIDSSWIHERWDRLAAPEGTEFRKNIIKQALAGKNVLYKIAVVNDQVVGFIHAEKRRDKNIVQGLYTLSSFHGSGVAHKLMLEAEHFRDPSLPTELEVASDNARAIAFYEKYGFERIQGSQHLFADKIPVIRMVRRPEAQINVRS